MASEKMMKKLIKEGRSEADARAILSAIEGLVERTIERYNIPEEEALKFLYFSSIIKEKAMEREKVREEILKSQSEDREITTWDDDWNLINPTKERALLLWLNSLPKDVIRHGKNMKSQFNHGVKYYPPEHWEKVDEYKFKNHLTKLRERREEIMQQEDIHEIAAMLSLFEVEEMLLSDPKLFKTCPRFLLEELDDVNINPYRKGEYYLTSITTFCI